MAVSAGTLLWQMRMDSGLSLGQLARKAGVDKSALSRWESGVRQPRIAELEGVLDALQASPAQRAGILATINAPRAIRRLRTPVDKSLGSPPTCGDLLRAMRLRRHKTQEEVAARLGVARHTVARWELGERLPANEQIQALCYVLEATETEVVALTTGRFSEMPSSEPSHWDEKMARTERLLIDMWQYRQVAYSEDLQYLILARDAWQWMTEAKTPGAAAVARNLLANVYANHATYFCNEERWAEVIPVAQRALALRPRQESGTEPTWALLAAIVMSAAMVYQGGKPPARSGRGVHLLRSWIPRSTVPEYTAWMLSDMARYVALDEDWETALTLSQQAHAAATQAVNLVEPVIRMIDRARILHHAERFGEALPLLGEGVNLLGGLENLGGMEIIHGVDAALMIVEASVAQGERSAAHEQLRRANAALTRNEAGFSDDNRPKRMVSLRTRTDALMRQL